MKQQDLTPADFDRSPTWQFVSPGDDMVEPWPKKGDAPLLSLVATECVASDGSVLRGYALLTKISLIAPVVFAGGRQIKLQHGTAAPSAEYLAAAYADLNRSGDVFFPVKITMTVTSQHRPLPTTFHGFVYRSEEGAFVAVR